MLCVQHFEFSGRRAECSKFFIRDMGLNAIIFAIKDGVLYLKRENLHSEKIN